MKDIPLKPFELFFGTGGVGKTTVACSRAVSLAQKGHRILLLTIDPAKRLKDILNIDIKSEGEIIKIDSIESIGKLTTPMDVMLMSSKKTIERMAIKNGNQEFSNNRIIEILIRPNGGMNEILSLIEIQKHLETKKYDSIILDTPPGAHFLDFLDSVEKIKKFFDYRFIAIFQSIGRAVKNAPDKKMIPHFFDKIIESSVNKLLTYLQKVTGENFVNDFLMALQILYSNKEQFLEALKIDHYLQNPQESNWFLVTSVEQGKILEAKDIFDSVKKRRSESIFLVLNKIFSPELEHWETSLGSISDKLKKSVLKQESSLIHELQLLFPQLITFPEILEMKPQLHIKFLAERWS